MMGLSARICQFIDWATGVTAIRESYKRKEATLEELTQKYLDAYKNLEKDKRDWEEKGKSKLLERLKRLEKEAKHYKYDADFKVHINNQVIRQNKGILEKNIQLTECLNQIKKTIASAPIFEFSSRDYVRTMDDTVSPYKEGK